MNKSNSLKMHLLKNLMIALTLAWIITLVAGYLRTQETLDRQFDAQLKQIAESLSQQIETNQTTFEIIQHAYLTAGEKGVEFQIWRDDKIVSYSSDAPKQALANVEGYSKNESDQKNWRVFSSNRDNSKVMVGQDLDIRNSIIQGLILSSLWPMLIALPIIGLIIWLSVTIALKPLNTLALTIQRKSPDQLSEISLVGVPQEVAPVVQSLNDLLAVVKLALTREREFADNAAHELRTPLAGIKAQVEAALRSTDENEKKNGLIAANFGVDRAARIVDQLLTLARLEPGDLRKSFAPVNLNAMMTQVIAKLTPQALAKNIDLGLEKNDPISLLGDLSALDLMLTNLVENAIKYSPRSSRIDLSLLKVATRATLLIEDQGPGISAEDHKRVFERFVRLADSNVEGSGIGLSVVKKIADLHGIKIELAAPENHAGLRVSLTFDTTT